MPNNDLSILVVDDAKFSSAVTERTLQIAGYTNVRYTNNAKEALAAFEKDQIDVLIADWLMPGMDGLELTDRIRQIDEANNHYTYIILLTAQDGPDAMKAAFNSDVDDFINKSHLNEQLIPRLYAAERLSHLLNNQLCANEFLIKNNQELKSHNLIDPLSGVGNLNYCHQRTTDALKQCESRAGAATFLLIDIHHYQELLRRHKEDTTNQLIIGIARRLQQLVRPLDVVTRISPNQFAIITYQDKSHPFHQLAFQRIYDGINLKAFKTSIGYISAICGMSLTVASGDNKLPTAQELIDLAQKQLPASYDTESIIVSHWTK